jgi:hypothetical protein
LDVLVCSAQFLIATQILINIEAKAQISDIFNDFWLFSWGRYAMPAVPGPSVEGPHLQ